ncbi:MAG: NAD(P)-dependent alcohol dehydrogenase [Anaerolineaceae bacterium]|nr:NAD(P)-dependent alcohol dehydrogenase [Anaerolineaceae bacterium]
MKAILYNKSNAPAVLALRDVEKPTPREDEVLVKVHSVSVNAADYRSMAMGLIPKRKIFGADVAGVVEATGTNVRRFKVGDAVFGDLADAGFGGFAEYVAAPERLLARKPAGVSFEQAAALPISALTALQGLRDIGKIQPGMKVLIYGAGGGVGTFAVQLAKHFGAQVTAVCGPHNTELICALGADRVIDYTKEDITQSGQTFDLILGVNGSRPLRHYQRMLAPNGIFVMAGGGLPQVLKTMLLGPFMSLGNRKMRFLAAKANPNDLDQVIRLVAEGKIKPVIERTYPLEQTPEAVDYLRQGHARGKVVINVV